MKDKNISVEEYTATLIITWVVVILAIVAIFAGGSYALMKIFGLPWYSGLALFLLFLVIWLRKPKAS